MDGCQDAGPSRGVLNLQGLIIMDPPDPVIVAVRETTGFNRAPLYSDFATDTGWGSSICI